jgi:hypothetical protein
VYCVLRSVYRACAHMTYQHCLRILSAVGGSCVLCEVDFVCVCSEIHFFELISFCFFGFQVFLALSA